MKHARYGESTHMCRHIHNELNQMVIYIDDVWNIHIINISKNGARFVLDSCWVQNITECLIIEILDFYSLSALSISSFQYTYDHDDRIEVEFNFHTKYLSVVRSVPKTISIALNHYIQLGNTEFSIDFEKQLRKQRDTIHVDRRKLCVCSNKKDNVTWHEQINTFLLINRLPFKTIRWVIVLLFLNK